MKKLSNEQLKELVESLERFDKIVEEDVERSQESMKDQTESGDFDYIVRDSTPHETKRITFNEEVEALLEKSTISKESLVRWIIENNHFRLKYEELASPFQYGGEDEDEIMTLNYPSGDHEVQIDKESCEDCKLSFDLSQVFDSETFDGQLAELKEFANMECYRLEYINKWFDLFVKEEERVFVIYNGDYDIVRVMTKNDEDIVDYLKSNEKPEEPFTPRILKVTKMQYVELCGSHSGWCIKCGHVSDGFHEPDAEKYVCTNCQERHSYGIEQCLMLDYLEIVDNEEESNIDD